MHSVSQVLCETQTGGSVRAGRAGSVQVTGACRQLRAVHPLMKKVFKRKEVLEQPSQYCVTNRHVAQKRKNGFYL